MDATTTKVTLGEFGPASVWYTSIGVPAGSTVDLFWEGEDTEDGERQFMDPFDVQNCLGDWLDLSGTVDADGRWQWDGEGDPRDANRNTVTALVAYPAEA